MARRRLWLALPEGRQIDTIMNWLVDVVDRLTRDRTVVRNVQAGVLLENFLIAAVASVLVIRLYLAFSYRYLVDIAPVTGRVVVGPFHFAHMLWGGLLMLAGIVLLLTFIGRSGQGFAAVVAGVGFGAFIDELGKVMTLDNDYFWQPVFAIIYVIFVVLFVGLRAIQRSRPLSPQSSLVNALQYAQQAVLGDFGPEERRHADSLLQQSDQQDPAVASLREALNDIDSAAIRPPAVLQRMRDALRSAYSWVVRKWWFAYVLITLFVIDSVAGLLQTVLQISWSQFLIGIAVVAAVAIVLLTGAHRSRIPAMKAARTVGLLLIAAGLSISIALHLEQRPEQFVDWMQLVAPTISAILVMSGILTIWRSRLAAYRLFHLAALFAILVTQVFAFYEAQILAVVGLAVRVLILMVLRFMIEQEESVIGDGSQATKKI